MAAKILIVDDHEVVREGVRTLITRERPQWEVCGEAKSAQEAVDASRILKPDVTILDITMPGMSGLEVASAIFESGSRVLMFTMHDSEHLSTEVSNAGAQGFVLKSQAGKDLIRAIEHLLGGGTFFGSESNPQDNPPASEPSSGRLAEQSSDGRVSLFSFGTASATSCSSLARGPMLPTLLDFGHGTSLAAWSNGEKKAFSSRPDGRKTKDVATDEPSEDASSEGQRMRAVDALLHQGTFFKDKRHINQ